LGGSRDIWPVKTPDPLIARGSLPEWVKEKDPMGNRVTQIYPEKWPLNGNSIVVSL